MDDLSAYMKRLLHLHKKKGEHNFGSMLDPSQVMKRVDQKNEQRKNDRNKLMSKRRQLSTMSPLNTPQVTKSKTPSKTSKPSRLDMLAKWKREKEKLKLLEKQKLKPIFKVTNIPVPVGLPDLETVNTQIKGKTFKKTGFAPANHQFKPPANLQPLHFSNSKTTTPAAATGKAKKNVVSERSKIVTRSQTRSACGDAGSKKTLGSARKQASSTSSSVVLNDVQEHLEIVSSRDKTVKKSLKSVEAAVSKRSARTARAPLIRQVALDTGECVPTSNSESSEDAKTLKSPDRILSASTSQSSMSPDFPANNTNLLETSTPASKKLNGMKTPEKTSPPPMYISPFVTLSRGKSNARKEYHYRKSGGASTESKGFSPKFNIDQYSSPTAGAAYFTHKLENEIAKLQNLCDQWTLYKTNENPPEEAVDMIDVAIGQSTLLTTKKFVQFKGLIEECKNQDADRPVTCEDLHGFWDMIYMQVVNLEKRFDNLNNLMANNWKEIIPEPKKPVEKKQKKTTKKAKATSTLREAIQAARLKKQSEEQQKTPRESRKSILNAMKSSEKKRRDSSPGLMMMKVAQIAKNFEAATPAKSILKTDGSKSTAKSKAVLFKDDRFNENLENDLNSSNTLSSSKVKVQTPRRSARLSRAQLFN